MPQRAPGDLTEEPFVLFLMLEYVGFWCFWVFVFLFWGVFFFHCLEGTGINGNKLERSFWLHHLKVSSLA